MTTNDRLAAIIAEHQFSSFNEVDCRCGWVADLSPDRSLAQEHGAHVAERIADDDDLAVIEIPVVGHKAVGRTDADAYAGAAWRMEQGYKPGGSNMTAAVVELLRRVAKAAAARP